MRSILVLAALVAGCSSPPSAATVCQKLAAAGVAANCRPSAPGGLGAAASERQEFDLPDVAGKTGQVLRFADAAGYDATVKAFDAAAVLAGPHRYGSAKARVYVQLNSGAAADVGAKARAVVDSL